MFNLLKTGHEVCFGSVLWGMHDIAESAHIQWVKAVTPACYVQDISNEGRICEEKYKELPAAVVWPMVKELYSLNRTSPN